MKGKKKEMKIIKKKKYNKEKGWKIIRKNVEESKE